MLTFVVKDTVATNLRRARTECGYNKNMYPLRITITPGDGGEKTSVEVIKQNSGNKAFESAVFRRKGRFNPKSPDSRHFSKETHSLTKCLDKSQCYLLLVHNLGENGSFQAIWEGKNVIDVVSTSAILILLLFILQ